MAAKAHKKAFVVTLNSRDASGQKEIRVTGNKMEVNHRGDLLIVESTGSYGSSELVAAFRSGTWVDARFVELLPVEPEPAKPKKTKMKLTRKTNFDLPLQPRTFP